MTTATLKLKTSYLGTGNAINLGKTNQAMKAFNSTYSSSIFSGKKSYTSVSNNSSYNSAMSSAAKSANTYNTIANIIGIGSLALTGIGLAKTISEAFKTKKSTNTNTPEDTTKTSTKAVNSAIKDVDKNGDVEALKLAVQNAMDQKAANETKIQQIDLDGKKQDETLAKDAINTAKNSVKTSETSVKTAEKALADHKIPEEVKDENGNITNAEEIKTAQAKKIELQKAVDTAKQELKAAKEELTTAKEESDKANKVRKEAETQVKDLNAQNKKLDASIKKGQAELSERGAEIETQDDEQNEGQRLAIEA